MMPITTPLIRVASEQAELVAERYPGYRADLIVLLAAVMATQDSGRTAASRRNDIKAAIEAIGGKVAELTRRVS